MSNANYGTTGSLVPPLWLITLAVLFLLGWVAFQLKELCVLLVVSYCIAYLYQPAIAFFERPRSWRLWRGPMGREITLPRPVSFILLSVLGAGLIALLAVTAFPTLARQYERLSSGFPGYVQSARERVVPFLEWVERYFPEGTSVQSIVDSPLSLLNEVSGEMVQKVGQGLMQALLGGYSLTLTLVNLSLLPFIVFYLAVDMPRINRSFLSLIPPSRRTSMKSMFEEIDVAVSAFVRGQFLVGCILFVMYAAGLGFVGVELWFLLALIAGFGNFIPYLGFIVGIVLSTLMAIATFGTFGGVLQVWLVFAVVQLLEGFVITPKIVGDKVGLSPLVVILALFAGGQLFGLLGILLAVPGAAVLRVVGRRAYEAAIRAS